MAKIDHTATKVTITTPLGELTGLEFENGTRQFLNVKYGTFPRRFAPSSVLRKWNGKVDGTRYGPRALQTFVPMFFPDIERPWLNENTEESETDDILTLNITVPQSDRKNLPVLFWIHGGANMICGVNTCEFDGIELANLSVKVGLPTIIVTVEFRLGFHGFLWSKEIRELNEKEGFPAMANLGLWDQTTALKWVRDYISAFGGDHNNVTIFGQSAGSASAHLHAARGENLFNRVILQSGTYNVAGLVSEEEAGQLCEQLMQKLGISTLAELIETDANVVKDALQSLVDIMPFVADESLFPHGEVQPLDKWQAPEFLDALMLGDTKEEFSLNEKVSPEEFYNIVSKVSPELLAVLKQHYGVTDGLTQEETLKVGTQLITDGLFALNNWVIARQGSNLPVYYYHFDQTSDFVINNGKAHHSLDFVYVWQMFNGVLKDSKSVKLAVDMGTKWIQFANGMEPWPRYSREKPRIQIFGYDTRVVSQDSERHCQAWDLIVKSGLIDEFVTLARQLNSLGPVYIT